MSYCKLNSNVKSKLVRIRCGNVFENINHISYIMYHINHISEIFIRGYLRIIKNKIRLNSRGFGLILQAVTCLKFLLLICYYFQANDFSVNDFNVCLLIISFRVVHWYCYNWFRIMKLSIKSLSYSKLVFQFSRRASLLALVVLN